MPVDLRFLSGVPVHGPQSLSTIGCSTVIGIDVGGSRKVFHAVALTDGAYAAQLNAVGIRCFASPSRERAVGHPSNVYGWMLQGEALFRELEASNTLLTGLPASGPVCFETFPHAITWHLRVGHASGAPHQHRPDRCRHGADRGAGATAPHRAGARLERLDCMTPLA